AWPYLELIAGASGIDDPLDARVVEAYWVGNGLLDNVTSSLLHRSLEERFRGRAGRVWPRLADTAWAGAVPHHSFHVFGVYPWLGLLRSGQLAEPLQVLDRCRIRWGQVLEVGSGFATVRSRPLRWDQSRHELTLGEARPERVQLAVDGLALASDLAPGQWCALHWDWVCDRLDPGRLRALRDYTCRQLRVVSSPSYSPPAAVLS
ncbi:MAG TPA: DUF6390 family protein, partial [Candidatus Lustribacter sp.]|nr:DUF6390 family protein [Candidatus Lustribacter sp.]